MKEAWNKEDFIRAVKENTTIAGVLRQLNKETNSYGFYTLVHRDVKKYNLDTSHWLGRNHSNRDSNIEAAKKRAIPLNEILVENSNHSSKGLRSRLLSAGILPYECAICSIKEWQNKSLSLHLDHINGIHSDNRIENLRLLCPNCHSQTDTYCGRNIKNKSTRKKYLCQCGKEISYRAKKCEDCFNSQRKTKIDWPSNSELLEKLKTMSCLSLAKELGVSDNTIRKRLKGGT